MIDDVNPMAVEAFKLWCKGMRYARIGRQLNIDERTAKRYVLIESERRQHDMAEDRDAEYAQSIEIYETVRSRALLFLDSNDPETFAKGARFVIDATRCIDRINGIDSPVPPMQPVSTPAGDVIRSLPPAEIMALVRAFANRAAPLPEKRIELIDAPTYLSSGNRDSQQ